MATGLSKTDYFQNAVLTLLTGTAFTALTDVWVGLFTATPTDSTAGTEVTGTGYARQSLVSSAFNAPLSPIPTTSSGSYITTNVAVTFSATGTWGTVGFLGIFDASTGGHLLYYGALGTAQPMNSGNVLSFPAGDITIQED